MRSHVLVACLAVAAGAAAADDRVVTPVGKDTVPVTITGCLLAGTRPDTFVLKNVTDSAGRADDVIYWLSTTRGLKDHVGQMVEVSGPVVAISEGELEVKTNPAKSPDTTIQVKARGKEAKARTEDETAPSDVKTRDERTMPVHRIKVRSVRMVAPTCG